MFPQLWGLSISLWLTLFLDMTGYDTQCIYRISLSAICTQLLARDPSRDCQRASLQPVGLKSRIRSYFLNLRAEDYLYIWRRVGLGWTNSLSKGECYVFWWCQSGILAHVFFPRICSEVAVSAICRLSYCAIYFRIRHNGRQLWKILMRLGRS